MINSSDKSGRVAATVFVTAHVILFPLIQFTPGDVSSISSYISIVLVFLFSCLLRCEGESKFVRLGLAFTLVADYFLVICDDAQLEGVIAFIFVQASYCAYLTLRDKRKTVRFSSLVSRVSLSLILIVAACIVLGDDVDALAITSVLYYANLVLNTVFAFLLGKRERIFAIGLLLFCMCDLCIGLEVLFSSYMQSDVLDFFYSSYLSLPWVFYQPSQVLIGLSLLKKGECEIGETNK